MKSLLRDKAAPVSVVFVAVWFLANETAVDTTERDAWRVASCFNASPLLCGKSGSWLSRLIATEHVSVLNKPGSR